MQKFFKKSVPVLASVVAIYMSTALTTASAAMTFVHPGAVNSKADLDYVKAQITANPSQWSSSGKFKPLYDLATPYTKTSAPAGTQAQENATRDDAKKAYANALAWYYTGRTEYANNAIAVLNVWANTFAGYTVVAGTSGQSQLNAGWIGALMGPAAEIMRGYSGWPAEQQTRAKTMFATKFYPALSQMSNWNGNVDLTQIDALMNIAVFNENEAWFNEAKTRLNNRNPNYFYLPSDTGINYSGTNPSWFRPTLWTAGLTQETCRTNATLPNDNGHHAQFAMASALRAAEVAWNQGDASLYTNNQTRYTAVMELLAKQINTGNMQSVCADSVATRNLFDTFEIGYRHYNKRMGLTLSNTQTLIANAANKTKMSDWNIFYESLTHGGVPMGTASSAASSVASSAASSSRASSVAVSSARSSSAPASSAPASSAAASSSGATCGSTNFNKTAAKGIDMAAAVGDCIRFNKTAGTLQIGSWSGRATSYDITSGAQGVTNAGAGFTSVTNAANGYLYIKVKTAGSSFSVKFDHW